MPRLKSHLAMSNSELDPEQLRERMRSVPDFPIPGILFRDITTVVGDSHALRSAVSLMANLAPSNFSHIAAIEARGFILGSALAVQMNKGFVPIRKQGKLPAETISLEYGLEYGKGMLEIHKDAVEDGTKVWVVDDLIATGGSLEAACKLIEGVGGKVAGVTVMVELDGLDGWKPLSAYEHGSVFHMDA